MTNIFFAISLYILLTATAIVINFFIIVIDATILGVPKPKNLTVMYYNVNIM